MKRARAVVASPEGVTSFQDPDLLLDSRAAAPGQFFHEMCRWHLVVYFVCNLSPCTAAS